MFLTICVKFIATLILKWSNSGLYLNSLSITLNGKQINNSTSDRKFGYTILYLNPESRPRHMEMNMMLWSTIITVFIFHTNTVTTESVFEIESVRIFHVISMVVLHVIQLSSIH